VHAYSIVPKQPILPLTRKHHNASKF